MRISEPGNDELLARVARPRPVPDPAGAERARIALEEAATAAIQPPAGDEPGS